MSAEKFIQHIEDLGLVDDKVVRKIRKQVANPDKNVSAKAIAKYLVEKNQLTSAQAKKILAKFQPENEPEPVPVTQHEEIVVNQPTENAQDTSELIGAHIDVVPVDVEPIDVEPVEPAPVAVEPVGADATVLDLDPLSQHPEPEIVEAADVHQVPVDQVEAFDTAMIDPAAPPMDTFDDPFGDPNGDAMSDSQEMAMPSFKGKKTAAKPWTSKWLFIAPAIIGVLVIIGFLLVLFFKTKPADELWDLANDAHVRGDYAVAMETFDEFMRKHSGDDRVDTAKVYRVRSLLAQSFTAKQWQETYNRAKNKLPEIEELEEFNEIRETLADVLPKTARGFATVAKNENDIKKKEELLGKVNQVMELVETPSYIPTKQRNRPVVAKVIEEVEDLRRAIRRDLEMENTYVKVLAEINQLTSDGQTNEAINKYQTLTSQYPKLKPRAELQKAIQQAAIAEQNNVKTFTPDMKPVTTPPPTAISKTILLSSQSVESKTAVGLEEEVIAYLVDGSVYMFDCGTGKILWRKYVGYRTRIEPNWTDKSREKVVLANSDSNEMACYESQSGKLLWRLAIGSPFHAPRMMDRAMVVTTLDGQLLKINLADGTVAAAAKIPQQTTTPCTANSSYIFQPGQHTNLYVFSAADMTCQAVTFVGADHIPGSITVPPHIVAGHLFLLVNGGNYSNLHIYRIDDDGKTLTEVQFIQRFTLGVVNTPMVRIDRWVVVASDSGDMKLMEVNKAEEKTPVTQAAAFNFSVDDSLATKMRMNGLRHFIMSYSGKIWIGNQGLTRFKMIKSQGKITRDLVTNGEDIYLGPIVRSGDFAMTLRRRGNSALASLACINPNDHSEVWRTDFSAPNAGSVFRDGNAGFVTSSQGDIFAITSELIKTGSTNKPRYRGSKILQDLIFSGNINMGPGKQFFYGPLDQKRVLNYDKNSPTVSQIINLISPSDKPSCPPIKLGDKIVMSSRKGQIVLIDPGSGQAEATPFQPEVQPGNDIRWCRPVAIDDQQFVIADGDAGIFYLLKAASTDVQKVNQLDHEDTIKSPIVKVGNQVVAVDNDGTNDRLVSLNVGNSLEKAATVALPADYVAGPMNYGSGVVLILANNNLVYYEASQFASGSSGGNPKWTLPLAGRMVTGQPVKFEDKHLLAMSNGDLVIVNADGSVAKTVKTGEPLAGTPVIAGNDLLLSGRGGHIHVVPTSKLK